MNIGSAGPFRRTIRCCAEIRREAQQDCQEPRPRYSGAPEARQKVSLIFPSRPQGKPSVLIRYVAVCDKLGRHPKTYPIATAQSGGGLGNTDVAREASER